AGTTGSSAAHTEAGRRRTRRARHPGAETRPGPRVAGTRRSMRIRLAHLAQEDSRLPATSDTVGSLTRVVHELTLRLARQHPLVVYSVRHRASDPGLEERDGVRHVRLSPEPDRTVLAAWFRWRNRLGRRLGVAERPYAASPAYYWTYIRRVARRVAADAP